MYFRIPTLKRFLMKEIKTEHPQKLSDCQKQLLAINDALDIIRGKWKIKIIGSLMFGNKRFKELQREISGITAKMLSKELRDLEVNQLVLRTVFNTIPPTVEYSITPHGLSLEKVIDELNNWGLKHRKKILGK